jgi:hypothetical protein
VLIRDQEQECLVRLLRDVVQVESDAWLAVQKCDGPVAMRAVGMEEDVQAAVILQRAFVRGGRRPVLRKLERQERHAEHDGKDDPKAAWRQFCEVEHLF